MTLRVSPRDQLVLSISDDGQGSATSGGRHHHGLSSLRRLLRDQGGALRVSHGARGGTTVTATIPLAHVALEDEPQLAAVAP